MKIKEHNLQTGEIIEREMTEEELIQLSIQQNEEIQRKEERALAESKLAALGLTADDFKALGL